MSELLMTVPMIGETGKLASLFALLSVPTAIVMVTSERCRLRFAGDKLSPLTHGVKVAMLVKVVVETLTAVNTQSREARR